MADEKKKLTEERSELAALDTEGLLALLEEEKKKQWTNRFAMGKRQLEDTASLAKSRKRIARIHTYLRMRELTK